MTRYTQKNIGCGEVEFQLDVLVGCRFETFQDVDKKILEITGEFVDVQQSSFQDDDDLSDYDMMFELGEFDIDLYYLIDKRGFMYITEVGVNAK